MAAIPMANTITRTRRRELMPTPHQSGGLPSAESVGFGIGTASPDCADRWGARQIRWILGGGACFAADPEVVEAVAEDAAAQGGDGVDAVDGPMHVGAFAAGSEDVLAAGLDDAGADAQTHGADFGYCMRWRLRRTYSMHRRASSRPS